MSLYLAFQINQVLVLTIYICHLYSAYFIVGSDGSEPRSIFLGIGLEIFRRAQARDQFFEKGLENWDFYVVKKEARQD